MKHDNDLTGSDLSGLILSTDDEAQAAPSPPTGAGSADSEGASPEEPSAPQDPDAGTRAGAKETLAPPRAEAQAAAAKPKSPRPHNTSLAISMVEEESAPLAKLRVVGVGGAGCNAINRMVAAGVHGVEFVAANTDLQSLRSARANTKIQLGKKCTKGLGAGSNPELGRKAAEEAYDQLLDPLQGSDMVFITAGLGKGTGTGASPYIAALAAELDCLVVAVVCTPFKFEGTFKMQQAEAGLAELRTNVDTVIVIPNERLPGIIPQEMTIPAAFARADEVLCQAVRSVSDLITVPGEVNLDFADVRRTLKDRGKAFIGTGEAEGEDRASQAVEAALHNPLLGEQSIEGASALLVNITTGEDGTFQEMSKAIETIHDAIKNEQTFVNWGCAHIPEFNGKFRATVIAAGFSEEAGAARLAGPRIYAMGGRPLAEHEIPTPKSVKGSSEAAAASAVSPKRSPTFALGKNPAASSAALSHSKSGAYRKP